MTAKDYKPAHGGYPGGPRIYRRITKHEFDRTLEGQVLRAFTPLFSGYPRVGYLPNPK